MSNCTSCLYCPMATLEDEPPQSPQTRRISLALTIQSLFKSCPNLLIACRQRAEPRAWCRSCRGRWFAGRGSRTWTTVRILPHPIRRPCAQARRAHTRRGWRRQSQFLVQLGQLRRTIPCLNAFRCNCIHSSQDVSPIPCYS